MNRYPDAKVREELRKEVGFGCPVKNCGCPYLTWHHFDPPWNEKQHHDPEGMIALCAEHHNKADAGAFTKEQLKELKSNPYALTVKGKFDWMRRKILLATGSGYYVDPYVVLRVKGENIISFTRDSSNFFLINIKLPNSDGSLKFTMEENMWLINEKPEDLISPPSGKYLKVKYKSGDKVEITFFELATDSDFKDKYGVEFPAKTIFPITAVEIIYKNIVTSTSFTASKAVMPGLVAKNIFSMGRTHTVFNL
jgi:hypothetical protein